MHRSSSKLISLTQALYLPTDGLKRAGNAKSDTESTQWLESEFPTAGPRAERDEAHCCCKIVLAASPVRKLRRDLNAKVSTRAFDWDS